MDEGFGIYWRVAFRCDGEPTYLIDQSDQIVDRLSSTRLWKELDVFGALEKPAKPIDPAAIKKALLAGKTVYVARGDRDALMEPDRSPARVTIAPQQSALSFTANIRGESLARLGGDVLSEVADLIAALAATWRAKARMFEAWATPDVGFTYPRVRPPQTTKPFRALGAVIDLFDAKMTDDAQYQSTVAATRMLATAQLPAGVERREANGVVIVQWVKDPTDSRAAAAACTRHEQWLLGLLPHTRSGSWNDAGDLRLTGNEVADPAPFALVLREFKNDRQRNYGHVAATTPGWQGLGKQRQHPKFELDELRLLAASREEAVALAEEAKEAGFDRVVYRDDDGTIWDADPPGPWVD